jgi:hypothetical protein
MGSRLVAWLIALLVVVALAATGIYLYRQQHGGPSKVATGEGAKPVSPAGPQPSAAGSAKHTAVPSFDVVRIEPTGEGVIAGQAEPGWTVKVESAGTVYGEAITDEEGAWSIVLDKPLPAGNHSLALTAYSPDGTRALTAQQPVRVAVGKAEGEAPSEQAAEASNLASQPQPVVPDENAPRERGTPPVKINSVEYQDKGEDSGTISLSGIGQPHVQVYLFFDNKPLGELNVGEDGTWTFEAEKRLDNAEHTIRADTYDEKTRVVQGRASVRLGRVQQAPAPAMAEQKAAPEAAPAVAEAERSGQPQPVYPEEAPEEAATSSPPTAPAPEPYDLSSQPQPVYPGEATAAEAGPAEPQDLSSQRQPVYPEETTVAEAAPAEPQDLSSQPQPVYPKETAAEESARKMAAETPAEPPQPEAVPPEPGAPPVTAERPTEEAAVAPKQPPVVFKSVDYQDKDGSGSVSIAGTGEPSARIFLFYDEQPLGEVTVGDDGTWAFEGEKRVEKGEHNFRAERLDERGVVISQASIGIVRLEEPKAPEEEVAAAPQPAPAPSGKAPSEETAATEAKPPAAEGGSQEAEARPKSYVVQRGDTLWDIAEEYYDGGWRYRAIVRENRRQIRNPHWIYPDQQFRLP